MVNRLKMLNFASRISEEAHGLPPFRLNVCLKPMLNKEEVLSAVESALEGTELFPVNVEMLPDNVINVEVDSMQPIDIDAIALLTRRIQEILPAEELDEYELEVGSAGLTSPFKVRKQWEKNIGNEIDLLTNDGRKLTATLSAVNPDSFTITYIVKEKAPGEKRPKPVEKYEEIPFSNVKRAAYHFSF